MSGRTVLWPERLTVPDLRAILDQAVEDEAMYRVDGWVLRLLVEELLERRHLGRHPVRRQQAPPGQQLLF